MHTAVIINGISLERVSCTKFLGVFIDHKLTWKEHILYLKNKVSKCIAILCKVSKVLSKKVKMQLYKTFIQPHFMYCNIVWCLANATTRKPLEISQKRTLKIALGLPKDTPSTTVFNLAKVHDLVSINNIHSCIFMYKYAHKLLPSSFDKMFTINSDVHNYNTRICMSYRPPPIKSKKTSMSVRYKGVILWNKLKSEMQNTETLQAFKCRIKKHFV